MTVWVVFWVVGLTLAVAICLDDEGGNTYG